MTIHAAMRAARKERKISQAQLARKSRVHVNLVRKYESGAIVPGLYNLIALADALDISIDEYIGRRISVKETSNETD